MSSAAPTHVALAVDDLASVVIEAHEERRWLVWAGGSAVVAAVFLGISLGTGKAWIMTFTFLAVLGGIVAVVLLAFASDTNSQRVEPAVGSPPH